MFVDYCHEVEIDLSDIDLRSRCKEAYVSVDRLLCDEDFEEALLYLDPEVEYKRYMVMESGSMVWEDYPLFCFCDTFEKALNCQEFTGDCHGNGSITVYDLAQDKYTDPILVKRIQGMNLAIQAPIGS